MLNHPEQAVQRFAFSVKGVNLGGDAALHNFLFGKRAMGDDRHRSKSSRTTQGLCHAEAVAGCHFYFKDDDMGRPCL
ncbi:MULTISPECIES: hypothetical protein [Caballeronia]|uniref:hypothetical protein n=1 Tax=Caballeronia TaxID=1827195 RepID=UPI001EF5CABB|nr:MULTISPECIES: hypothetical protein [Caballeronia]MCG7400440.1 hypothetical protein [Caballeronia zhejiangensis]